MRVPERPNADPYLPDCERDGGRYPYNAGPFCLVRRIMRAVGG